MKHLAVLAALLAPLPAMADVDPADWEAVTAQAEGQTVYWNAWGGSTTTNDFIAWVGSRVAQDHGVTLHHVKLTDTADAVTRVLSEKQAGQNENGAIDMIWINGANFAAMKEADLLFGPYAEQLPNWALADFENKPALQTDFTVPVDGNESPWAMAQVVFMHDPQFRRCQRRNAKVQCLEQRAVGIRQLVHRKHRAIAKHRGVLGPEL